MTHKQIDQGVHAVSCQCSIRTRHYVTTTCIRNNNIAESDTASLHHEDSFKGHNLNSERQLSGIGILLPHPNTTAQ